jgi:PAS domain S-box-containing protein
MWRLLNTPRPVDPGFMRVGCAIFLVVYVIITFVRYEESHQSFFWLRLLVCGYAALGIGLARTVTWRRVRAYTVGLGFVLPLQAAYVDGLLGNQVGDVAISALATFIPLVFMQTGRDLLLVDVGLILGHIGVLAIVPPPGVPLSVLAMMVGGAIGTGTAACLQALMYRALLADTLEHLAQANTESAEWKNRYDAASMASGQVLYDWDCHTNEVSYGGAYERMLGFTGEELSGGLTTWVDLIHPDDREAFHREVRRTVEERIPFRLQYRVRRKGGAQLVVEDTGHFVQGQDGKIARLIGFVADVTERTVAESLRAEAASTSAALVRVGQELISSLETPVVLERLCRLSTEVLGADFSQTWLWRPDEQVYEPSAYSGAPIEDWEALRLVKVAPGPLAARLARDGLVQVTPSSTEYSMLAGLLAYYGVSRVLCVGLRRGDELIGIHGVGFRVRSEPFTEGQERMARGIEQLASMALTNARLVEELERASRLKSEFVSTMSHELRTPLNVILGYTDMLADALESGEHATLLASIRHSSLELLEMIEATLDLNRLAAGKDVPQLEQVQVLELWDELRQEFEALPCKESVAIRWEPAGLDTLITDRRKLKMIVKNLVGNALKFTSAGVVETRCVCDDAGAVVSVRDTGIGIAPEQVPHIFDMFRQVDSSDRRSYNGAGLGLYIVHRLVNQLGGTIDVDSLPGQGSTFRVTLPAAPVPERGSAAA